MSSINITWDKNSILKVNNNIKNFVRKIQTESRINLALAAEEIMEESYILCPYDTDTLRNTGNINTPELSSNGSITVTMDYAGVNDKYNTEKEAMASTYAVEVHEEQEWKHKYPTQWQFLATPVNNYANKLLPMLASGLKRLFK